jgi:threonine dehydratase
MSLADLDAARSFLSRSLVPSRLIRSDALSSRIGANVYLKMESELPTGSFKVRGALYALWKRSQQGPVTQVVAASTGNHGAAVAFAAQRMSVPANIFVPRGANPVKLARIRAYGGEVTECGPPLTAPHDSAADRAASHGVYLLDDASDAHIPVATGTIAAELFDQLPTVDAVYVPVGDTALIRGVAGVVKARNARAQIIGVQARGAPAYFRSWQSGEVVTTATANTMADGLATTRPLEANVIAIRSLVDDMVLMTEDAMLQAVSWLLFVEHVVAEPAGAATVAALMADGHPRGTSADQSPNIVLLITGSNIAPSVLRQAAALEDGRAGKPITR